MWRKSEPMPQVDERNVRRIDFMGVPAVRMENERLAATVVPDWGSRVVSLWSKEAGAELLRVPASLEEYGRTSMLYGIPVLFPPNRIEDGAFSYGGRNYRFDINDPATGNHSPASFTISAGTSCRSAGTRNAWR